jgi:hypothetical protein
MYRIPPEEKKVMRLSKIMKRLFDALSWRKSEYAQGLAEAMADPLEELLNRLNEDNVFGVRGSADPRGDFREGKWDARTRVQGVDR